METDSENAGKWIGSILVSTFIFVLPVGFGMSLVSDVPRWIPVILGILTAIELFVLAIIIREEVDK